MRLDERTGWQLSHADLAAADARAKTASFQRVRLRVDELLSGVNGCQPVTELVGEVVTGTASAVTFDKRSGSEVFQTRAGTGQGLTSTVRTGTRVLRTHA